MSPHTCPRKAAWGTWLSPQLTVVAVPSIVLTGRSLCGHRHPSCPAGALHSVSCPSRLPGHPRERGGRKELLPLIVPSSAGSDNNSFLHHASGPAVGPMGWGCSHAAAWCRERSEWWDWHGGVPDLVVSQVLLPAGGHWGHGWGLFHGAQLKSGPLLWLLWAGSSLPHSALDTVCLSSCPQLVPAIPGWSERMVESCPPHPARAAAQSP